MLGRSGRGENGRFAVACRYAPLEVLPPPQIKARATSSRLFGSLPHLNQSSQLIAIGIKVAAQRVSTYHLSAFPMKFRLLLASAFACSTSAALAQTVLPSGAVAPAGAVIEPSGVPVTPATVPGSQPLSTPDTRDGGSPRAARHDEKVPGLSPQDRKRMRKMGKMKFNSDAEKQSGKK